MADSRRLEDLDPRVADMCRKHQHACQAAGIPFRVTFTLRSIATQNALYAQGRTAPGKIVTNARGGYSFHNYGLAYDGTPESLLNLPSWGDTPAHQKETNRIWALYGRLGKEFGLRWGGDFKSIKDRPHMEWSGSLSLADLRAGKRP
jgi:peptidoglycan L-alanyl-D-glutamate endopeptidase CwlK